MAKFKYFRFASAKVESHEVDETAFGVRSPRRVQREAVLMYRANARAGTHDTLTRAEVNATIRKPWKQKHTGRARAGRTSSPIWRGGGIIFGPHPRDYSYSVPRKALRAATRASLAGKLQAGAVAFVDAIEMKEPKTRKVARMLEAVGAGTTCLIVLPERDDNVWKSARNIPGTTVKPAADVNAYDVLSHRTVLLTPRSFELLKERVGPETYEDGGGKPAKKRAARPAAAEEPAGAAKPKPAKAGKPKAEKPAKEKG
jgi:large subunit ribosomal protein L4